MPYDDIEYNTDSGIDTYDNSSVLGLQEIPGSDQAEHQGSENLIYSTSSAMLFEYSTDIDYTDYLNSIIEYQEAIITNQESIISYNKEIMDNGHRLYYFVGGFYVAFAIIIMVKFFKTFLF